MTDDFKKHKNSGGKRINSGRKYQGRDKPITLKVTNALKLYHQDHRAWAVNTLIESFNSLPSEIKNEYIKKSENND